MSEKLSYQIFFVRLLMQEAQTFAIRLSARHKPLSNMGSLRPDGAVPILKVLLVSSRVAIESLLSNMSLHSLRNARAKLRKRIGIKEENEKKQKKGCQTMSSFML